MSDNVNPSTWTQYLPTAGWLGWPLVCYYGISKIPNPWLRGGLTTLGCAGLISYSTQDQPLNYMKSIMNCSLYWMVSIRLVHLMTLPDEERKELSLLEFAKKFVWFAFPISKRKEAPRPPLQLALHVAQHSGLALVKMVFANWMSRWMLKGLEAAGGAAVVKQNYLLTCLYTCGFFGLACSGTWTNDILVALVSLLTLDRYEVLPFNDWPMLAASPRELWGLRYNKLVSGLLKESVFLPLKERAGWPARWASLAAFVVSGVLHMHVAKVGFGGGILPAGGFFLAHGLACGVQDLIGWKKLPRPIGILLTQAFMIATSPLYPALFVSETFFRNNPPAALPAPLVLPVPDLLPGRLSTPTSSAQ